MSFVIFAIKIKDQNKRKWWVLIAIFAYFNAYKFSTSSKA